MVMNALRRVASAPGVRSVLLRPTVRRAIAAVFGLRFLRGAWATTTPWRFAWRELFARGQVHRYVIGATGVPVITKHGRDIEAVCEIFTSGEYEPPAELAARLRDARRVVDVGANVGMFSAWALGRWPGVEIVAFEPEPDNVAAYREWLAVAGGQVELIAAAAAPEAGELPFLTGRGAGSQQVGSEVATTVLSAVDVFPHLAGADLVKIDIEGGEWPILADPRLADVNAVLVMEFHRVGAPSLPAAEAAASLLEVAGFSVGHIRRNHWGHGVLWAWK